MRDYAELVKALRDCSRRNARVCMICGAKASNLCEGTKSKRMFYAADAIVELQAQVPHWISVDDALPEEWREVLTYMPIHSDEKNPHMIQICWYIGNGKWRETEYGEIVEIPITHWMPLPEPPKGVE